MLKLVLTFPLLSVLVPSYAKGSFISDMVSQQGLDIGNGINLKLGDTNEAAPVLERVFLDLSYGSVGVSVRKAKSSEDVALDFYVKDGNGVTEGRNRGGNKGGNNRIGMIIAFKSALVVAFVFIIMKLLIIKAIILAKVSLIISLVLLVMKLKNKGTPELLEIEQHGPYAYSHPGFYSEKHPGYAGYSNSGIEGGPEAAPSDNSYDVVYAPTGVAENTALYANVAAANRSLLHSVNGFAKKYDISERKRKRSPSTLLTLKRISAI